MQVESGVSTLYSSSGLTRGSDVSSGLLLQMTVGEQIIISSNLLNYSVLLVRLAWMLSEACASCLSRQHTWATHGSVYKALSRAKLDAPASDSDLPHWGDTVIPERTLGMVQLPGVN